MVRWLRALNSATVRMRPPLMAARRRFARRTLHCTCLLATASTGKSAAGTTCLGYESSDSYKNPNFTRSYGYSL